MVQIREKDLSTRELVAITEALISAIHLHHGRALLNDRVDLVLALGADGVHLRSDSLPVSVARRLLHAHHLIGVSTHSIEEVRRAEDEGADFAVLGPIYETPSKRPYGLPLGNRVLEKACRSSRIPIFAIGGITSVHVPRIMATGAYGIAMISFVLQAPSIPKAINEMMSGLLSTLHSS